MKVLIAGEGPTELGDWASEPAYRPEDPVSGESGAIVTLLQRIRSDGWEVAQGRLWRTIRKYRAGQHRKAETRTVLGLALEAWEANCGILAFCRDNDRSARRHSDVQAGIELAREKFEELKIVGGMAVEEIEAWVLALLGDREAEQHADPKQVLREQHRIDSVRKKVEVFRNRPLATGEECAPNLKSWLDQARAKLADL